MVKAAKAPRIYLDSNVYIAFLNGGDSDHARIAADLMRSLRAGDVIAIASELLRVELSGKDGVGAKEAAALLSDANIEWSPVDRRVAELARTLVVERKLKPADAIHLATASLRSAERLMTWDERFYKAADTTVLPVSEPSPVGQGRLA